MCGRYYRTSDKQAIAEYFKAEEAEGSLSSLPAFNIAPTTAQPVVRQSRDIFQREIVTMRWGMVGYNSKGPDPKRSTFNARCESLESSGLWRGPLHRHRCVVPANGFFEWEKPTREAWRFSLNVDKPLGFAGLWDAWKDPRDGAWLQSFSIITVPANTLLSGIHDRMPAILHPHEFDHWLDRAEVERAPTDLLRPFETNQMVKHRAHPNVGNVRNQGPEMLNSK